MGLVQKSFSDIITFSRSSNATRVGPTGVLEYAPHNLILQSQTFETSWTSFNSTVTANSTAAPNGTVTAESITVGGASATGGVYQVASVSSGATYTFSAYFKKGVGDDARIGFTDSGLDRNVNFNLATGTITSIDSGVTGTITSAGNSWYRVTVTRTVSAASVSCYLFSSNAASTGDLFYLWGAQLAVGPYALDYVPTTSAAVYGPRFDYDGSGVTIVEPVSTNLVLYSQEFENAAWVKSGSAVTANVASAPDGTVTADRLQMANLSQTPYQVFTFAAGTAYTFSCYVKRNGAADQTFRLAKFQTTTQFSANFTATDTWQRFSLTFVGDGSAASPSIYFSVGSGGAAADLQIWGAQLEVGSTATAYMVSGATNGFRAVPVVSGSATPKGLLVEEQRTNLLTYSEQFDNAAWLKDRSSVTLSGSAPDGTVSAFLLAEDTTAANDHYIKYAASAFSANTWTLSVFAKKSTRSAIGLRMLTGSSDYVTVVFNLDTGLETKRQSAGGFSAINATSTAFGNGWYRLTLTATAAGGFDASFLISNSTTPTIGVFGEIAYNGDGSSGVYVWGAQLEAGSFATSYIPTLASTVTRSADVASVNTLSPWYSSSESTLFAEFDITGAGSPQTIASLQASAAADGLLLYKSGTGLNMLAIVDASSVTLGTLSLNTAAKVALAYNGSANGAVLNGGSVSSVGTTVSAAATKLSIGASFNGTSNKLNGHIRRIAYYPRRLTNAELQALTA